MTEANINAPVPITPDLVPENVAALFNWSARQLVDRGEISFNQLGELLGIWHDDETRTYAVSDNKTYPVDGTREELIYLVNIDQDQQLIGYGEIRHPAKHHDPYFREKPFVGYTRTEREFRKRGFGRRRILEMGQFTMHAFGLPLYSSKLIRPKAKRLWQGLAEDELATAFVEGEHTRFVLN